MSDSVSLAINRQRMTSVELQLDPDPTPPPNWLSQHFSLMVLLENLAELGLLTVQDTLICLLISLETESNQQNKHDDSHGAERAGQNGKCNNKFICKKQKQNETKISVHVYLCVLKWSTMAKQHLHEALRTQNKSNPKRNVNVDLLNSKGCHA